MPRIGAIGSPRFQENSRRDRELSRTGGLKLEKGKPGRPPHGCFTSPKTLVVSYDPCMSAYRVSPSLKLRVGFGARAQENSRRHRELSRTGGLKLRV